MILGVASLITPLTIHNDLRQKEIPYSIIAVLVIAVCGKYKRSLEYRISNKEY